MFMQAVMLDSFHRIVMLITNCKMINSQTDRTSSFV